jgi:flagellin
VQRQLSRATQDLSTSSERLSSGQRINKASDDAAGLAISTGLDKDRIISQTAKRNVNDGISVVSTLTSGIKAQKEILFRMAELSEQSANGTYSSVQREGLQKEYGALMDEFDRIADTTEFNGVKLLRNPTPQTIQLG